MSRTPPTSRAWRGVRFGADRLALFEREDAERRAPFEEERGLRMVVRRMLGAGVPGLFGFYTLDCGSRPLRTG